MRITTTRSGAQSGLCSLVASGSAPERSLARGRRSAGNLFGSRSVLASCPAQIPLGCLSSLRIGENAVSEGPVLAIGGLVVKRAIVTFLAFTSMSVVSRAYAQLMPESLLRLKPSANLRVETTSHQKIEGRFLRATGDTLFLSAQGAETVVPLRELHCVWRRGRATKTGAIFGGLVGAIGLSVLFRRFLVSMRSPTRVVLPS